jgi:hypothetical protein
MSQLNNFKIFTKNVLASKFYTDKGIVAEVKPNSNDHQELASERASFESLFLKDALGYNQLIQAFNRTFADMGGSNRTTHQGFTLKKVGTGFINRPIIQNDQKDMIRYNNLKDAMVLDKFTDKPLHTSENYNACECIQTG